MTEAGWRSIRTAAEEISRDKPIIVLVRSLGGAPIAGGPWIIAAAYRTKHDGWLNVATGLELVPIY